MNPKSYLVLTAVIFLVIALLHLARAVVGWGVIVENQTIPVWVSWVGFVVAGILSIWGFALSGKTK